MIIRINIPLLNKAAFGIRENVLSVINNSNSTAMRSIGIFFSNTTLDRTVDEDVKKITNSLVHSIKDSKISLSSSSLLSSLLNPEHIKELNGIFDKGKKLGERVSEKILNHYLEKCDLYFNEKLQEFISDKLLSKEVSQKIKDELTKIGSSSKEIVNNITELSKDADTSKYEFATLPFGSLFSQSFFSKEMVKTDAVADISERISNAFEVADDAQVRLMFEILAYLEKVKNINEEAEAEKNKTEEKTSQVEDVDDNGQKKTDTEDKTVMKTVTTQVPQTDEQKEETTERAKVKINTERGELDKRVNDIFNDAIRALKERYDAHEVIATFVNEATEAKPEDVERLKEMMKEEKTAKVLLSNIAVIRQTVGDYGVAHHYANIGYKTEYSAKGVLSVGVKEQPLSEVTPREYARVMLWSNGYKSAIGSLHNVLLTCNIGVVQSVFPMFNVSSLYDAIKQIDNEEPSKMLAGNLKIVEIFNFKSSLFQALLKKKGVIAKQAQKEINEAQKEIEEVGKTVSND